MVSGLTAPFPYYGGKRRWAADVWARLGRCDVYVEPFAGSLAILLTNPWPCKKEVVSDTDGMICNFWRAVQQKPDEVAEAATWPTIHQDLTARRIRLRQWRDDHADRLSVDADYCDAQMAGWWVWAVSNSIGAWDLSAAADVKRPRIHVNHGTGTGISQQRKSVRGETPHVGRNANRPIILASGSGPGVSQQSKATVRQDYIVAWMRSLQDRLRRVIVLNKDGLSILSPTILSDLPSIPSHRQAIMLDPPYVTSGRSRLYASDGAGTSDDTAQAAWQWALKHGDDYRIVYFAHEGDFPAPSGWEVMTRGFGGINDAERRAKRKDCAMFSPACQQTDLFAQARHPGGV